MANGILCCKGILDSGADATIISRTVLNKLTSLNVNINLIDLHNFIILQLPNGDRVQIKESVEVDLTLETKLGKLVIPHQKCLVWDDMHDDIILGIDMLSSLGIDPKHALDSLITINKSGTPSSDHLKLSGEHEQSCPEIGIDNSDEIVHSLKIKVKEALNNGMSSQFELPLLTLLLNKRDTFRRKLGPDAPASVTPFKTKLINGARPIRCRARQYSKEQSEFLFEFTNLLQKFGLIRENCNAEWASPVQVVKKEKGYRMVVDLRAVNAQCEPTAWPMPFLESIVQYLSCSKIWFLLDAFKGFWIMPLDESCQEIFSFMTDRGVFTPTRSIQGAKNSATQFQARMTQIFTELLFKSLIIWIDDLLGHADSEENGSPF